MNRVQGVEAKIRSLPDGPRVELAFNLATLVLPFGELTRDGQPERGLALVASRLHQGAPLTELEQQRHLLWTTPELAQDEEPGGLSFFCLGATVAWIYLADSLITSPSDGPVNVFRRVADLLGFVDDDLDDTGLLSLLCDAIEGVTASDVGVPSSLSLSVRAAVGRLSGTGER